LNDKTIKELMSFAKWLYWTNPFVKTYIMANMIAHL
jgi:hypothetical protein